jgi:hypothetical protein
MNQLLTAGALLAATLPIGAQNYFTTPKGFSHPEGNNEVFTSHPLYSANARFQYTDGTQAPTSAKVLKDLAFRRRASEVPGPYGARTTNLTLIYAHTTYSATTTTFATNYKGSSSTTTYSGVLNLPDMSAGPLPLPAPWVVVPLTTTFPYNGTDDLLIEFQCANTTPSAQQYPLDTIDGTYYPGGYSIYNGIEPCQVTGRTNPFWINANNDPVISGGKVSYDMYATDGPASQAAVWILGLTQIYNNLGGALCAHLQPTPQITVPMMTDAIGNIGTTANPVVLSYSYPGYVHLVFAQFVALDPAQGSPIKVALSDDLRYLVGDTGPWNVRRLSTTSGSTAATGTLTNYYVPIFRHGY